MLGVAGTYEQITLKYDHFTNDMGVSNNYCNLHVKVSAITTVTYLGARLDTVSNNYCNLGANSREASQRVVKVPASMQSSKYMHPCTNFSPLLSLTLKCRVNENIKCDSAHEHLILC
jgi:hypothetical protein